MANPLGVKRRRGQPGQALVEYVLIVVLVSLAVVAIITATGPALGNVFSNTVYNLVGQTVTPYSTLNATDFWKYVTAVASYTPPVQTLITNTPANATIALTSIPNTAGPSPTNTATPTPTTTVTPGPSPTPPDIAYQAPFFDQGDTRVRWQYPLTDAWAALPWTGNFYNGASWGNFTPGGVVFTKNYTWAAANPPAPTQSSDISFNWYGSPGAGVSGSGFSGVFTNTAPNSVPLEGRVYQAALVVGINDGAVFKINGSVILSIAPNGTEQRQTVKVQFPAASNYNLEVDFFGGNSGANSVQLVFSVLADTNRFPSDTSSTPSPCNWNTFQPGRSGQLSWQDSPGAYNVSSNCNLRLRGSIDISTLTKPRMVIWDKWSLGASTHVDVGIRDYTSNNDWTWVTIHTAGQVNANWQREFFDLKSFGGMNFLSGSKKIEIAYRLVNTDPMSVTSEGWYIDDIAVEQDNIDVFPIPSSDNVDGTVVGGLKWLPECGWALSSEQNHTPSGNKAFTDSPLTPYTANTDCSLNTDGVVDLTGYGGGNPSLPQLVFWDMYFLAGTTTKISVEAAPIDNRTAWQPLTPVGSVNPYIAMGTAVASWKQEVFDLISLAGQKWFFRFRILTDNGTTADGWYVDDILFRERPSDIVGVPFYEPFETVTKWTLGGTWNLTQPNGVIPAIHRSGATGLTDSPAGNYIVPSLGGSNTAQLISQINLNGTTAPMLEFWTYWKTSATANLYLEMSTDAGATWPAGQILWKRLYNDTASPYSGGNYNTNLAWTRYVVNLTPYACPTGCPNLTLRFRLEALAGSTPDDGWYIEDLSVTDNPVQVVAANAFQDNIESNVPTIGPSTNNWHAGGAWSIANNVGHNATKTWASQPSGNYTNPEDSVLELVPTLDLTGVANPILSFWNKYAVNSTSHFVLAEISTNNGQSWSTLPWVSVTGFPVVSNQTGVNLGWSRQQMDLTAYVSGVNKQIRLRFRLKALDTLTAYQGWWLDDVYVGPRNTTGYNLSFGEDFNSLNRWTTEGDWQSVNDFGAYHFDFPTDNFVPVADTYGGSSMNTQWDADYYHFFTSNFVTTGRPATATLCGPLVGSQISAVTTVGDSFVRTNNFGPTFSWTDGTPTQTTTNTKRGGVLDVAGSYLQFTVPADQNVRTMKLYMDIDSSNVTTTMTLSDGSAGPYSDTVNKASGTLQDGVYTTTYAANSAGKTLTVRVTINSLNGAGRIALRAISLAVGAPGAAQLSVPSNFVNSASSINLTTEGTSDWAFFNLTSDTDVQRKACVKSIQHVPVPTINFLWNSSNIPANGAGNSLWTTDANDYEYFMAFYTRKLVINAGTYRFWLMGADGIKLLIDGTQINPSYGGSSLPYPWKSKGSDGYIGQSPSDYFYEATIGTSGQHTIEVDFFHDTGSGILRFQMAEKSNMLHSSAAATNYTINQDTAAYLNGSITIPANAATTLNFYERFVMGSSGGNPDPIRVLTSKDGGFTWQIATVKTIAKDSSGNATGVQTVNYGYNAGDTSSPWITYQNWQLHTVDLGTDPAVRNMSIKFELDSRVSTSPADGWYIDEITVTQ